MSSASVLRSAALAVGISVFGLGCTAADSGDTGVGVTTTAPEPTTATTVRPTTTDASSTLPSSEPVVAGGLDLAYELLDGLADRGFVEGPDYRRDDYLDDWPDSDGDCLDDRDEVLVEEAIELDRTECRIRDGFWIDPYFGVPIADPGDASIDHVVALAEAHWAGGHAWSDERRRAYATDLGDPDTLVVTTRDINFDKGALPPQDWMPSDPERACAYAVMRVRVMTRWSLAVRSAERTALENALNLCPDDIEVAEVELAP